MTRQEAIAIFGSVVKTAKAVGISKQAVYAWPDMLPSNIADRVLGAAWRHRIAIPDHLRKASGS